MKRLLSILLLLAVTASANPFLPILSTQVSSGGGSSFPSGAVVHYKLDEASGTRNDSVGSNHLTDNNTVSSTTGKIGTAALFVAANSEYLSLTDNATVSVGGAVDFTLSAWVYLNSTGNQIIVYKASEYGIFFTGGAFVFDVIVGGSTKRATWGSSASTATWYHVVGWFDSTAQTVNISVDNGAGVSTASAGNPTDGTNPFIVGSFGGASLFADARIDSVTLWKKVLTGTERSNLYNSGSGLDYP